MNVSRFRVPAALSFRQTWREFNTTKDEPPEAWRRHGETLRATWESLMQSVLSPPGWLALRLLLERQYELRWLWIRPGGFLFTRANNPRKVKRDKLRPQITTTVRDKITDAEQMYVVAQELEGDGFTSALQIATLALAGTIQGGEAFASERTVSIRHTNPVHLKRREDWWPWPRTVRRRLRALRRAGLLEVLGDKEIVR